MNKLHLRDTLRKIAVCGAVAASVFTGIAPFMAAPAAAEVRSVDVQRGKALKDQGAILLDVREPHEYAQAHVPGSIPVPLGQLGSRLQEIRALGDRPVAVICQSGRRSAIAAETLDKAGFTGVHNIQGGMIAWEKAGLPLQRGGK